MQSYCLDPIDTLFFKDARPMQAGAGSGGHGASWPLPSVLHESLRSNLLHKVGERPDGKKLVRIRNTVSGPVEKRIASESFRSLRTLGPFPCRDGTLHVPTPVDLVPDGDGSCSLAQPVAIHRGSNDLDSMWLRPALSRARPGKAELPEWVSWDYFLKYLEGVHSLPEHSPLFEAEQRIGIGIDPEKKVAAHGRLFASEHLRLREGTSLWFKASLSDRDQSCIPNGVGLEDCLGECVTLGGESRLARLRHASGPDLELPPPPQGRLVKWILLTHAVFLEGWLPSWIDKDDGKVKLRGGATTREQGESRYVWRKRIRGLPEINAHLVAALASKPVHFSGWDLGDKGPKPTMLAVPAGSVFFFQAADDEAARELVSALHGRTRSDCFGEKGFGYGVCGSWEWRTSTDVPNPSAAGK